MMKGHLLAPRRENFGAMLRKKKGEILRVVMRGGKE